MLNLGPCSMLPMHLHARAANYVVAIHGNTTTYMYEENGARLVTEVLTPGHGTIIPQASMHMMMNTGTFPVLLSKLSLGWVGRMQPCTNTPILRSQAAKTPSSSQRSTPMTRGR